MKKIRYLLVLVTLGIYLLTFSSFSQNVIIKNGDVWNYFDSGYLDNNWVLKTENYKWKSGITPLGYGDKLISTEINFGTDPKNKQIVKYFKKEIEINENEFLGYEIRLLRDDGAVIYINGVELLRSNMLISEVNNKSLAKKTIDGDDEKEYLVYVFENSIFNKGKNTIAVSIHQSKPKSSDCIFSLELIGHSSTKILEQLVKSKNNTNKELQSQIRELSVQFELEKTTNKNETLSYVNYNLKVILIIVIILFILALVSIYFIIENQKRKSKEINNKIYSLKKKVLDKEKEMLALNTKLLNNKQYFKEIKTDIKGIQTQDKTTQKIIISEINEVLDKEDEWEDLKNHFDAVYDGFYDKLIALHPKLSETELRHCMFIRLHMQTKEIARVLLIDPRSVQTTRYRIKKKMNLGENIDLRDYLLNI